MNSVPVFQSMTPWAGTSLKVSVLFSCSKVSQLSELVSRMLKSLQRRFRTSMGFCLAFSTL